MKLKYEFVVRNIMDEFVLVPVGEAALKFAGMITTSEVGAFLIELLKKDTNKEFLVQNLMAEYEVCEDQASQDVDEFLAQLNKFNLLLD